MQELDQPAGSLVVAETQDVYEGELPERIEADVIRQLSEIRPALSVAHIALEWTLILTAATLGWRFWHPLLYPLVVVFIGARQHALLVLAHDAAHFRLFRNRRLNDWVGEVALAWPFIVFTMQAYRRNHFPHHRHLNTVQDPDWMRKQTAEWVFPKTRLGLFWMLLAYASGFGFLKFLIVAFRLPRQETKTVSSEQRLFAIARLLFIVSLLSVVSVLHVWRPFLLFWIVPYVTWMQVCFQVRSIAEHFAITGRRGIYGQTRTVLPTWFDRVFAVPKNVNYHLEHHLYPSVPFYRLPELHRLLMERPAYRTSAHLARGYLGVLRECVTLS